MIYKSVHTSGRKDIIQISNGIFTSNTYLCLLSRVNDCVIIDPGLDSEKIDQEICSRSLTPKAALCTHGHFDHLGSAAYFQKKYDIPLYLHKDDIKTSKASNFLLMACKIDFKITVPEVDQPIENDFVVSIGEDKFRFFSAPGHTPGSCIIQFRDCIFTGDTLYKNAVGLVSLPGEDKKELKASILRIFETFSDETTAFPGHGGAGHLIDIRERNLPLRTFLGLEMSELA